LLPPDRVLASALAAGRGTVVAAYDLLRREGRVARRQGSGTRVCGNAGRAAPGTTSAPVIMHLLEPPDGVIQLACAAPEAPPPELIQAYHSILPEMAAIDGDIGYHPAGDPALRRAIADRYQQLGVPARPEQIVVTNGGQQALSLLGRLLISPGDRVLVEAPTYPGALEAFRESAAVLRPLPAGLGGFESAVPEHRPVLGYVIASYHNPTGAVLQALQRQRLAAAAAEAGVPLIDDEVLADLGFPGEERPPPLAAYGSAVISVGSLSKVVWGGHVPPSPWSRGSPGCGRCRISAATSRRSSRRPTCSRAWVRCACAGCGSFSSGTITCARNWLSTCPNGTCPWSGAGRPCGCVSRTVTATRSPSQRCAMVWPSCPAAGWTRPDAAGITCASISQLRLAS